MPKRILLVEGTDDEHVLKHICGNRGISHLDEVKRHGGIEPLLESLPVRLKASEDGDILGVVVDADLDAASRWQSLRDRLMTVGYADVPERPATNGTIINVQAHALLPRIGIWIMPDNQTKGFLEDFLNFLVPLGSQLFAHAITSVDNIPANERRFREHARTKALIHTWLAWQEEPGKPLGTAITAHYLDPDVPQVNDLVYWLKSLFFPD
jgi:hypothetical protein